MDPKTSDENARSSAFSQIQSINLFGEEGMVVTSNLIGAVKIWDLMTVELEADYQSYRSLAITHKQAEHLAHKSIDQINHQLVHH